MQNWHAAPQCRTSRLAAVAICPLMRGVYPLKTTHVMCEALKRSVSHKHLLYEYEFPHCEFQIHSTGVMALPNSLRIKVQNKAIWNMNMKLVNSFYVVCL